MKSKYSRTVFVAIVLTILAVLLIGASFNNPMKQNLLIEGYQQEKS